jgi:hypothetical protein
MGTKEHATVQFSAGDSDGKFVVEQDRNGVKQK